MIRVLIADDHPLLRTGLTALLSTTDDIELVAAAGTPEEAIAATTEHRPDVALLDLQYAGEFRGAELTRRLLALPHPPSIVILTNYDSDGDILQAIEAGAEGYLLKDAPPAELLDAVRNAAAGRPALTPAVASRLLSRMRGSGGSLSARELEVLQLVADGLGNGEIAARLFVTEATVKSHLAHAFPKLGVTSRTAAVAAARDAGLIRRT